jgi:hypothetical protein
MRGSVIGIDWFLNRINLKIRLSFSTPKIMLVVGTHALY